MLIFDEVQECPNIISALKYFCQDFAHIPVIATGSMVRIKIQRETHKRGENSKFLFPVGKINQITIYPMTFDEFLMNSNRVLYEAVKKAYKNKQPLDAKIHELAMEQVYKYLLVGGMPEAVETYITEQNLMASRELLKVLYDNYLSDMELYQASREAVLRSRNLFSNTLSGIFFENFVANELVAKGHKLFYWRGRTSSELEFIVESEGKLYPIDVKKGRGTLNSLEKFANHNKFECAIKVSKNNYGYSAEQKLLTVPFYFFPFVAKELSQGSINPNP